MQQRDPYIMQRQFISMAMIALTTVLMSGPVLAGGDAVKGKRVFNKCKACHNLEKNKHKVGPSLAGLIDRKAGTAKDSKSKLYRYSKAMKNAGTNGIVWNRANLDRYLTKPKAFIPKNKMTFPGLKKPLDRANVIAYIKSKTK